MICPMLYAIAIGQMKNSFSLDMLWWRPKAHFFEQRNNILHPAPFVTFVWFWRRLRMSLLTYLLTYDGQYAVLYMVDAGPAEPGTLRRPKQPSQAASALPPVERPHHAGVLPSGWLGTTARTRHQSDVWPAYCYRRKNSGNVIVIVVVVVVVIVMLSYSARLNVTTTHLTLTFEIPMPVWRNYVFKCLRNPVCKSTSQCDGKRLFHARDHLKARSPNLLLCSRSGGSSNDPAAEVRLPTLKVWWKQSCSGRCAAAVTLATTTGHVYVVFNSTVKELWKSVKIWRSNLPPRVDGAVFSETGCN